MTLANAIPLQSGPARFLRSDWAELVRRTGSKAVALTKLSKPDPGILAIYRHQAIKADPNHADALAKEQICGLVDKMIVEFRTLGAALAFDFNAGTASGAKFSYSFVVIEEARPASDANELVGTLVAWLRRDASRKRASSQKILKGAAKKEFASAFRLRAFNDASKQVFARPRGRPTRSEK